MILDSENTWNWFVTSQPGVLSRLRWIWDVESDSERHIRTDVFFDCWCRSSVRLLLFPSICFSFSLMCVDPMWTCMTASSALIQLPLLASFSCRGFHSSSWTLHATGRTSFVPCGKRYSRCLIVWSCGVETVIMWHVNKSSVIYLLRFIPGTYCTSQITLCVFFFLS